MAKNKITDLRDHLFDVIERLKSKNDPDVDPQEKMDIATASAITKAAHVIVESTKMEIEVLRIMSKPGKLSANQLAKTFNFVNMDIPELPEDGSSKVVFVTKSKYDNGPNETS